MITPCWPAGLLAVKQQKQHIHTSIMTEKQITISTRNKNAKGFSPVSRSRMNQSNILFVTLLLSSRSPLQLSVSVFNFFNCHLQFFSSTVSSCSWWPSQFALHTIKQNPKRAIAIPAHTHKVVLCSMGTERRLLYNTISWFCSSYWQAVLTATVPEANSYPTRPLYFRLGLLTSFEPWDDGLYSDLAAVHGGLAAESWNLSQMCGVAR